MNHRRFLFLLLPFALGGCGVFDWATANMPVIGQRCENWQCFTSSGQQQSQLNEQERMHPDQVPGGAAASGRAVPAENPQEAPVPAANIAAAPNVTPAQAMPAATPKEPLAPAMPEGGAYVYVPRAKPEPGSMPFDGSMPPPIPSQ